MKAVLEFNYPQDTEKCRRAIHADDAFAALLDIYGLLHKKYASKADNFLACCTKAVAVEYCAVSIDHHSKTILQHCDDPLCDRCASRLSARLLDRILAPVLEVIRQNPGYGRRLRHVTLTTDITPEVLTPDRLDELFRNVTDTIRDCLCPQKPDELVRDYRERWRTFKRTIGYIMGAEFGENGHKLHFHVALYAPFIAQPKLSEVWQRHTSYSVVYITSHQDKPLADILNETIKYVTKFTKDGVALDPAIAARMAHAIYGKRRIRGHGLFFSLPEIAELDDPAHTCPECASQLVNDELGKYLEVIQAALHAQDEKSPDLSLVALKVIASAASNASTTNMNFARHLWWLAWGADDDTPDPREYADNAHYINLKFRQGNKSAQNSDPIRIADQNLSPGHTVKVINLSDEMSRILDAPYKIRREVITHGP